MTYNYNGKILAQTFTYRIEINNYIFSCH